MMSQHLHKPNQLCPTAQGLKHAQQDKVQGTKLVAQEPPELMNQVTALEEAAALHNSAQDPEWLAIAQNVPDGKQMQTGADEEVCTAGSMFLHTAVCQH